MAFDFESIKKKIVATAGELADKSAVVAKNVAEKTAEVAKKTKLNAEIAAEKGKLKDDFEALGRMYYEKYGEDADPDFAQVLEIIATGYKVIAEKQAELEALEEGGEDIEVEIVEVEDAPEAEEAPAEEPCPCCCGDKAEEPAEPCCCGDENCAEDKPE